MLAGSCAPLRKFLGPPLDYYYSLPALYPKKLLKHTQQYNAARQHFLETALSTKECCRSPTFFASEFYWCHSIPYSSSIPSYWYSATAYVVVSKPYRVSWLDHKLCKPSSITIFSAVLTSNKSMRLTLYHNLKAHPILPKFEGCNAKFGSRG